VESVYKGRGRKASSLSVFARQGKFTLKLLCFAKAATTTKWSGFWRKTRFRQNDALQQGVLQKQKAPEQLHFENALAAA